ncbi:MAG TPA: RNA polymerase Rpb4 family protein [Candidatus Thermoplasmatota archaeon]|nr:RNA polymerase Rpb4 family protein [Candidatus Thermoplasmatota archaeon]
MAQKTSVEATAEPQARFVPLAEVKALLERENEARGEVEGLAYEQKLSLEHATIFARAEADKNAELMAKLMDIGGKVTPFHAYKIADLAPKHEDDVRAIFAKDRIAPEPSEIEKILEIVRAYMP